jgi:hypothetical protein
MQLPFFNSLIKKFNDKINDTFNYKFKLTSNADYELIIEYEANAELLSGVFKQVSGSMGQGFKATLNGVNPNLIEKFEIPENLLNRVHTATHKNINSVLDRVRLDGIDCIRSKVESCTFQRVEDKTKIIVKVGGYYVRK